MQILGSIFGSLIYTGLIPGLHLLTKEFEGGIAPGCFGPGPNVTKSEVFGWEVCMTFLLVMTVYAAAVAKPGHGNTAPLAIGLSLYAAALTGEMEHLCKCLGAKVEPLQSSLQCMQLRKLSVVHVNVVIITATHRCLIDYSRSTHAQ